jgi:hypothetical protein
MSGGSTGGTFQLLTNKGIQDRLIMATDRLIKNIKKISYHKLQDLRTANPGKTEHEIMAMEEDWMPSMGEIDRSHIVFINSYFKPFVAMSKEYTKVHPRQGEAKLGSTFSFTLPIIGEFINDAVMYVRLTGLSAVSALDKVRYVEFLGHRLVSNCKFKVQNHEVAEYGTDEYNAHYSFDIPPGKRDGYLRNIGQELPKQGFLTADPTVDEVREYRWFGDGPQTFKQTHDDVRLWIPILFWFKDIQTALPNFLLLLNQTDIEVTFENENNLVSFADYGGGGAFNSPTVAECCLYTNHLFLLPEIHKIFITKFKFQLIRIYRKQTKILTKNEESVRLHEIKWPVEHMYVAFRPRTNLTNSQRWHRNTSITAQQVKQAVVTGVSTIQVNNAVYLDEEHPISFLELKAHDITIYPKLEPGFYNSYIPSQYGPRKNTPQLGWYMLPFNVNPGEFQPSGHFNTSRSRELYLNYVSATDANGDYIIRSANPTDLIVIAVCINFLLYKNGNLTLRFST